MNTHCTSNKKDGTPCRAWAVHGTDPPRCAAHRGLATFQQVGTLMPDLAQPDPSPDAVLEDIQTIIRDLAYKQVTLSDFINRHFARLSVPTLIRLLRLHADMAGRLGHLLRDQRALSGDAAGGIAGAIAQALDELSTEWGVPL